MSGLQWQLWQRPVEVEIARAFGDLKLPERAVGEFEPLMKNEMALVGIDPGPTDLKAVRTGIGQALQTLYFDVLREEVPDRIAELLMQLDQHLRQLDQTDRDST